MAIKYEVLLGCSGVDNGGMNMCVCRMCNESAAKETYIFDSEPDISTFDDLNDQGLVPKCPRGGERWLTSTIFVTRT